MDFLYMNSREPAVELDVQKEIVSGDAFFGKAKEYVTGDRETLLYRQEFFRDVNCRNFWRLFMRSSTKFHP